MPISLLSTFLLMAYIISYMAYKTRMEPATITATSMNSMPFVSFMNAMNFLRNISITLSVLKHTLPYKLYSNRIQSKQDYREQFIYADNAATTKLEKFSRATNDYFLIILIVFNILSNIISKWLLLIGFV